MDLTIKTETFSQDDRSWLASSHGTDTARSITLDTSAFTAGTHYPGGYLRSGTPLGKITASGKYGPYTPGATDGTQTFVGFLLSAVRVNVADNTIDPQGALLLHCFVVEAKLPVAVDAAAKTASAGRVIYV